MRLTATGAGILAIAVWTAAPLHADQHGRGGGHAHAGPKTTKAPTTHGPSSTTHGPSTHGPAAKGSAPKTKATKAPVTHGPAAKSAKNSPTTASTTTTSTTSTNTSTTTSPATTTASTVDFTSGKVAQRLTKNTNLTTKLETRLASLGYQGTVYEAAYGFKNLGQFVAATNVSQNLGLPFDQLKLQMTGLTVGPDGTVLAANRAADGTITLVDPADVTNPAPTKSLGQAIHSVDATVDSSAAAQTATTQANADIEP